MSILNKKDFGNFEKKFTIFLIFLWLYAVWGKKPLKKFCVWGIIILYSKTTLETNER